MAVPPPKGSLRDARDGFIKKLVDMQSEVYRLGLLESAHALNDAMNKAGWQMAREMEEQLMGKKK